MKKNNWFLVAGLAVAAIAGYMWMQKKAKAKKDAAAAATPPATTPSM